jgi:hypothetical protein
VHSLLEQDSKAIMAAFCDVFEDCTLWTGGGLEWILLGSRNSHHAVSEAAMSRQWKDPVTGRELRTLGIENPAQLGSLFLADQSTIAAYTVGVRPLTDDHPLRLSPTPVTEGTVAPMYAEIMNDSAARIRFERSEYIRTHWPASLVSSSTGYFRFERMVRNLFAPAYSASSDILWADLRGVLRESDLHTLPLWLLGTNDKEIVNARQHANDPVYAITADLRLAIASLAERDYPEALRRLEMHPEIITGPRASGQASALYVFTLCMNGERARALRIDAAVVPVVCG